MSASPQEVADVRRRFAAALDRLRVSAGITSLRAVARKTYFSHTTIADAVGGRKFPSLQVTTAFVTACGGDADEWRLRWTEAYAAMNAPPAPPGEKQEVADGNDPWAAGCRDDAVAARSADVLLNGRRHIIGQVELRYSRLHHAAWGRFRGEPGLDTLALHRHQVDLTVGVGREAENKRVGFTTEYMFDHHWSGLLVTGDDAYFAWVRVRFDGTEVAYGETARAVLD